MIGNRLSVAAGVALAAGMMGLCALQAYGQGATGGTITQSGDYWIHTFINTTGNPKFTPNSYPLTVEYLIVAGGGGGGDNSSTWPAGGGGAGGLVTGSVSVASEASVSVGVGGGISPAQNGSNSVFYGITAYGGGKGGNGNGFPGAGGGSGGGAGGGSVTTSSYTNGQGHAGGSGGNYSAGGGGGAGTNGSNIAASNKGGNGGRGITNSITGTPTGYAGGGGGGSDGGASSSAFDGGGRGGGNNGGPDAGTDGTGGGGGGSYFNNYGAKGGSGIVIVRYVIPTVKVTAPTNNQVFAWNYASITATATVANATVTSVDFYTNTASAAYGLAGSDSTAGDGYTLSLASGSLPAGTNHIYAVMTATEGVFTSAVNAIVVETKPVVTVAYPTDGQSFANLSSITATATVSHGISPYTVTFYTNNETAVGSDGSAPYASSLLGPLGEGSYQIYAKVEDSNPNGADTVYSTTNTITILAPALAVSVTGPTEYPYNGTIASTATVVFATGSYTSKVWTSSVPATVWGQAGADGNSTSPYGVSFGPLAPGSYSIRATVDDAFPASATSSTYTVTVLQAPTVTLNTPTPGQQFALNASVTGTVTCTSGKTPYTVTFYTNKNGSAYGLAGTVAGAGSQTAFTNVLSSLGTGTYGMYAVVTDAYSSVATSGTNIFLVGGTLPTLSHRPPTLVTTGSATFNGFLSTTGNPSTYVYVLYGQNPNAWSFTNEVTAPVGGWTNNSPISTNIGSLAEGTYYYTIGASNGAPFNATTNAPGTTNFITGEVTVQNTGNPAQYKAGGSDNGQFTIYRPDTCTNAALVVSYTLSGATVSPSGSATLNAGSTSAVVTVAPGVVVGGSSNAVLTLTAGAGNYPYGTPVPNSATCTVLATDVTPTAPFWAWGGDSNFTITVSGRPYAVHMYTNVGSGYFVPSKPIKNVEYLVIGGGGGGGYVGAGGGGGGAGGYRSSVINELSGSNSNAEERITLANTDPVAVTIGAGGTGATAANTGGAPGSPSSFGSIVAMGGGGGNDGLTNGAGGGEGYSSVGWVAFQRGFGTAGQGCDGGYLFDRGASYGGGGGGGAGGKGGNGDPGGPGQYTAPGDNWGQGGLGLTNSITGTAILRGGGGCGGRSPRAGAGGGGGSGANGTDGTGGGGGGNTATGGRGGSGIVIVRYDISPPKGTMILLR